MGRFGMLLASAALIFATQTLMADTWNKQTKVTFSKTVEVPGAVLQPGTYMFTLVESSSNRHIVKVQNVRGNKLYTSILAIPDYRLNASSRTVMYLGERAGGGCAADAPIPLKSWFYPGDNFGQRFVYPKNKATQLAAACNQPVPSTAAAAPAAAPEKTEVAVATPQKTETPYQPAVFEKVDSQDTAGVDGEPVKAPAEPAKVAQAPAPAEPAPTKLPKTGSPIPLAGGLGLLFLAASGAIRYAGSRVR